MNIRFMVFCSLVAICASSCITRPRTNHTGFTGNDMTKVAEIIRDKESKTAFIDIKKDMDWSLYAGPSDDAIDMKTPVGEYRADGLFPIEVPSETRSYFQFVSEEGSAILAERHLPMSGGYNFRDLGGYRNTDGNYVRWGKFIRSDEMKNLTDSDLEYLSSIPVLTVVDFRADSEVEASPDKYPQSVKSKHHFSINPGNIIDAMEDAVTSQDHARSMMQQMYRMMVGDPECVAQYRKFFELLQNDDNIPIIYHCSAGKDRTGIASALILTALGVDRETVVKDYLLSNEYLCDKYKPFIEQFPVVEPLMVVEKSYLDAGFDEIESKYGSVEKFLTQELNIDIDRFREKYLY